MEGLAEKNALLRMRTQKKMKEEKEVTGHERAIMLVEEQLSN